MLRGYARRSTPTVMNPREILRPSQLVPAPLRTFTFPWKGGIAGVAFENVRSLFFALSNFHGEVAIWNGVCEKGERGMGSFLRRFIENSVL